MGWASGIANQITTFLGMLQGGDGTRLQMPGPTVAQGNGVINTAGTYGHFLATATLGGNYHLVGWGLINFPAAAGQATHPVIADFHDFLNDLVFFQSGSWFRGSIGTVIGHAKVTIGGVFQTDIYHMVLVGSDDGAYGTTHVEFVEADGTVLGTADTLADGDLIEFYIDVNVEVD